MTISRDDRGPNARPNTLGLPGAAVEKLIEKLDIAQASASAGGDKAAEAKREWVRWSFKRESVRVKVIHPGGSMVTLKLACRNISCGGMSLLHSAFIHPGTRCVVTLQDPNGRLMDVPGAIVRCRHWVSTVHEVGVKFTRRIDAKRFLGTDPLDDTHSTEKVNPAMLQGCLVYIDDSETDRKIVKHFLRNTDLRVRTTGDQAETRAWAQEACDLMVLDFHLGWGQADDLVRSLWAEGFNSPVIVLTADASADVKQRVRAMNASSLLLKPVTEDRLLQGIADAMLLREEPVASAPASLIPRLGEQLARQVASNDSPGALAVCERVGSSATSSGLVTIAAAAKAASERLRDTKDLAKCLEQINELITLCAGAGSPQRAGA